MSKGELPNGWTETKLGDVIEYGKVSKAEPQDIQPDTWVLELEDIEKNSSKLLGKFYFSDRQSKSTKNRFKKGDVLYGKLRPYLSKIVLANDDGVCTTEIIPISETDFIKSKYLFYWLKSSNFKEYVDAVSYGVNMPRLGTQDGLSAPLVFAPLAEQQQIAEKLDEMLTQVDRLKARLDAIPSILKRFCQSVLAAAVSGQLTQVNVTSLGRLGDITRITSGVAFKKSQYSDAGSKLLQISNVGYGRVVWDTVSFIPSSLAKEHEDFCLETNDIVLALNRPITNETLKVAILSEGDLPATLYQRVARIRLKNDSQKIAFKYLFLMMKSPNFLKLVEMNLKGSDQPYLNTSSLSDFEIFAPSIEGQIEIVRRVEQLFAYADQIEQRVKDAQTRVNSLTQSILAKAFRGELTAEWREQNPDLISGENSAAALLDRIKAERAAQANAKKPRGKAKASAS